MKPVIIIAIAFALLFTPNAFAITYPDDIYEISGKTLSHSPTVCAFEPETDIRDAWKKLSKYTRGAVADWENKLNWTIDFYYISVGKQNENLNCDISIQFLPKPENKDEEFEIAGVTYRTGIDDQNIIIYYLNVELDRVDYSTPVIDGFYYSVIEWIPSYANYLTPENPLKMVIKHELGHTFGLDHYITENQDRVQRWYDGIERPPSIMIPLKPTKVISADITLLDIEKVNEIYKDGFYKLPETITLETITLETITPIYSFDSDFVLECSTWYESYELTTKSQFIMVWGSGAAECYNMLDSWTGNLFLWHNQEDITDQELIQAFAYLSQIE